MRRCATQECHIRPGRSVELTRMYLVTFTAARVHISQCAITRSDRPIRWLERGLLNAANIDPDTAETRRTVVYGRAPREGQSRDPPAPPRTSVSPPPDAVPRIAFTFTEKSPGPCSRNLARSALSPPGSTLDRSRPWRQAACVQLPLQAS